MELTWSQTRILGEEVLQPEPPRVHGGRDKAFKGLEKYEDLNEGDLLVHRDYGLAQFGGLHHMSIVMQPMIPTVVLSGEDSFSCPSID